MPKTDRLRRMGMLNLLLPLPMYVITMGWGFLIIVLTTGLLGYEHLPAWGAYVTLLPLLIPPALDVCGIVYGYTHRRTQGGVLCAVRSAVGLAVNVGLLLVALYLGSRF